MTSKRANGEGAIYRDKTKGGWRAAVDLGFVDGKRERKYFRGKTKAEVAKKVRDAQNAVDNGLSLPRDRDRDRVTVEQWLWHWHTTIQRRRLRETSYLAEETNIRRHVVPVIGKVKLRMLQPEQIEALYARLELGDANSKPLAPSSVLKVHRLIHRALKVAMQRDMVARNVSQLVDAPSLRHREVQPLTQGEARQLLEVFRTRRNSARWALALALGLRQGEALGLSWKQVDLEQGLLRVSQSLGKAHWQHGCSDDPKAPTCEAKRGFLCPRRIGHGRHLVLPKSRAGMRVIALPPQLVEELKAHRVAQLEERLVAGGEWWEGGDAPVGMSWDLVFRGQTGRPLSHHLDWEEWKRTLKEAGVRDARLHDARHTAASLLLAMGVPARVVMEILGHSQIGLTMNTYSHVMPQVKQDAAHVMGGALWGEPMGDVVPLGQRKKSS